jgi:dTDP-4-dehydrorhamnose reductase
MDKKRLLVIGANGFIGWYAVREAACSFAVVRGNRRRSDETDSVEVDISDDTSVAAAFEKTRPDAVLLLAAMSDIDQCEASPTEAFRINAQGAENVANACARINARLLFTSTAAVFDGRKHGYSEEDAVSPLSVYGKTKAVAEAAVQTCHPSAVIVRFALVIGFSGRTGTKAILDKLLQQWKQNEPVLFPMRESRNPIDPVTLSRAMLELLTNENIRGIYHVGAADSISRFELARRVATRAGIPPALVLPQAVPPLGRAPRGEDHFLLTDKLRRILSVPAPTSDQVIERCFS